MSYDGPVVSGWGAIARTDEQVTTIVHDPHRHGALMSQHRSRLTHFVIDVDDLDRAVTFWSAVLDATEEPLSDQSRPVYRRLRLPDSNIRILLQRTNDPKVAKERMHLDLETDNIEAEVRRLEALGATR
jgi:predicted enzyme related to lactoylglutathione lyase